MGELVKDENDYLDVAVLATAAASSVIIALCVFILFSAGIIDYIIESPLGGARCMAIALVPLGFGVAVIGVTMLNGGIIKNQWCWEYTSEVDIYPRSRGEMKPSEAAPEIGLGLVSQSMERN